MSNFRKKAIALAAVACVVLTSAASCSDSKGSSKSEGTAAATTEAVDANKPTLEQIDNEKGVAIVTPFQSGCPEDLGETGVTPPD